MAGQQIVAIGRKYGVRLMGPNIYVSLQPKIRAPRPALPTTSRATALSSQSGGIGMAIIGFSLGNGRLAIVGRATSPTSMRTIC
jgi:acyl-CoA synthetase (NDP forming)